MRQKQIIPQKQAHKKSHCFLFSKPLQKKLTFQSILEVPHSVDQTYLELAYFLHYEVKHYKNKPLETLPRCIIQGRALYPPRD